MSIASSSCVNSSGCHYYNTAWYWLMNALTTNDVASFVIMFGWSHISQNRFHFSKIKINIAFVYLLHICGAITNWIWCGTLFNPWEIFLCNSSSLCRGFISLEGKSYVLEPSSDHSDGTHWIYTAEHLNLSPGTCGHDFNISNAIEYPESSLFKTFSSRVRIIQLFYHLLYKYIVMPTVMFFFPYISFI